MKRLAAIMILGFGFGALLSLLFGGCTTTGRARAAVERERATPRFHSIEAIEPLIAFDAALDAQLGAGGLDAETYGVIKRWIGLSLSVLRGPHPDDWETIARVDWRSVRSAIGPYDRLAPFGRLFDSMIQ